MGFNRDRNCACTNPEAIAPPPQKKKVFFFPPRRRRPKSHFMRTRSTVVKLSPECVHKRYDGWNHFNSFQDVPERTIVVWSVTSLGEGQSGKLWFDSWQGKLLLSYPTGCWGEERNLFPLFGHPARSLPKLSTQTQKTNTK